LKEVWVIGYWCCRVWSAGWLASVGRGSVTAAGGGAPTVPMGRLFGVVGCSG